MANRHDGAVAYADRPDPDRRPFYEIRSPTMDREVQSVILSHNVLGVYTHYYNRRTRPCLGSKEKCEGCGMAYDRRWKAFLAAWDRSKGRLEMVEVTQEAFLRCPGFHVAQVDLRGMVIRLFRAGTSRNARVTAQLTKANWPPGILPAAFDVKAALERVWFTVPAEEKPSGAKGDDVQGNAQGDGEQPGDDRGSEVPVG